MAMMNINSPPAGVSYESQSEGFVVKANHYSKGSYFLIPYLLICAFYSRLLVYEMADVPEKRWGDMLQLAVVSISAMLYFTFGFLMYVRVKKEGEFLEVFTGVGRIGWERRFHWKNFQAAKIVDATESRKIVLDGIERISFGRGLTEARRRFIVEVLQKALVESDEAT